MSIKSILGMKVQISSKFAYNMINIGLNKLGKPMRRRPGMNQRQVVEWILENTTTEQQPAGLAKPCLLSKLNCDLAGYPKTTIGKTEWRSARLIATVYHDVITKVKSGALPSNWVARHLCNHPFCVEPTHIEPGTQKENCHDKIANGTAGVGSAHSRAILDENSVIEMRKLRATGCWTYKELGEKFGVHFTTVSGIINGHNWSHV